MSQSTGKSLPAPQSPPPLTGYIPTLDGWRAVAVAIVICAHVFSSLRDIGVFGVLIFFGISGILITSRMLEEQGVRGEISLKGFYIRRGFRILPPLFLLLIVLAIARLLGLICLPWVDWFKSLLFVRNYGNFGTCWCTMHIWSLSVEEHFYLLWPTILVFAGRRHALKIALFGAIAVALWRTARVHWSLLPWLGDFRYNTDTQLDILLAGAATAMLLADDKLRSSAHRLLPPAMTIAVFIFFALLTADCAIVFDSRFHNAVRLIDPVLICMFLAGGILHPRQLLGRVLEWPPIRWVGRLSYSLYLWQQVFTSPSASNPFLQRFPANIVAIVAIAAASYYILERPMMRLGHRLARPASPGRGDLRA
ncbi:MAG TPA: acyltransferase [Tepidisphaeraceae bacterium]|nr:acyltransferase [Tepidisphaeraceae bacterium]